MLSVCLCKLLTACATLASPKTVFRGVSVSLSAYWPQPVPAGTSAEPLLPWPDPCPLDLVQIMGETLKDPVIKRCCEAPNRLKDLRLVSEGLEKCQKSLNDYLDSKRNAFPRFFFISDDELLSILGSSDPLCVQEHMIKVGTGPPGWRGCPHGGPAPAVCLPEFSSQFGSAQRL